MPQSQVSICVLGFAKEGEGMRKGSHMTEEQREHMRAAQKGRSPPPHVIEMARVVNTGKHRSAETKRKISEANLGNRWTPEAKARSSERHRGKRASEETKQKMSETRKRFWEEHPEKLANVSLMKMGEKNPMYGKHEDHPAYGQERSAEYRQKQIDAYKRNPHSTGERNPMYGKVTHSKGGWYDLPCGEKIYLRSTYETRVVCALISLGVRWKYEPKCFELNGTGTTYTPDFLIQDNIWWEVKGYMYPRNKYKLKKFFELYPREDIRIIRKADIEILEKSISEGKNIDIQAFGNCDMEE